MSRIDRDDLQRGSNVNNVMDSSLAVVAQERKAPTPASMRISGEIVHIRCDARRPDNSERGAFW